MAGVSIQELSDELDIFGADVDEDQLLKRKSVTRTEVLRYSCRECSVVNKHIITITAKSV